jgi:hypothetical protein
MIFPLVVILLYAFHQLVGDEILEPEPPPLGLI